MVLGAGYSGLLAANLAARRTSAEVTLVNATDRFVERVRLHQLAAGQRLPDRPLADVVHRRVNLVVDTVTGIDPAGHAVHLAGRPEPLRYDTLVYALGSRTDLTSLPGAAEYAYDVSAAESGERLAARLRDAGTVAVVGGGLTGIETAAELAESHPRLKVRLVTGGDLGAALSAKGRAHLRKAFARLGVEVRDRAQVTEVRADGLLLDGDEHLAADTVVWTTGFTAPDLAARAGFAVDATGRMLVDTTLRSVSHPDVYAVGDAARARAVTGVELRMACATGLPSAQRVVRAIADRMAGREPEPLRFRYFNQCISLGRRDALIQYVRADDSPVEAVLTGRLAAVYKETIVRGAFAVQRFPMVPTAIG
ncbi:oxidoreductase [Amycolatopsis suaedae]|uniref:Oxidoreductase n=1 Tax=Amycolatopsis suaedae TaxID=2510978 RepID=A0A4Q7IXQ4_9PSEU|nr:oxidoreductase [Amycolatopsis suaedae]